MLAEARIHADWLEGVLSQGWGVQAPRLQRRGGGRGVLGSPWVQQRTQKNTVQARAKGRHAVQQSRRFKLCATCSHKHLDGTPARSKRYYWRSGLLAIPPGPQLGPLAPGWVCIAAK